MVPWCLWTDSDAKYGENYLDTAKSGKRLVRATIKNYKNTETYGLLKLFKPSQPRRSYCCTKNWVNTTRVWAASGEIYEIRHPKEKYWVEIKFQIELLTVKTKFVEWMFDKSPEHLKQYKRDFKYLAHPTVPEELTTCTNYDHDFHKQGDKDCTSDKIYHIPVGTDHVSTIKSPTQLTSQRSLSLYVLQVTWTERRIIKGKLPQN